MKAEQLYDLDYDSLKIFLLNHKDISKEILKDIRIKEKIINPDNKYEFIWFAQDFNNDLLPYLLDDEGIKILEETEHFEEKMLTKESIQKYRDEELSKKYGVDVYVLDKEPFYVLVKSLGKSKTSPLQKDNIIYTVDGASYSLDSSDKLKTYYNPTTDYNIAYTNFETEQIVHIYPVDSFSNYDRDIKPIATNRVFELHTPESLCSEYEQYNEIVIAQKNDRKNDELNNNLEVPEMFAIYCYDTIIDADIISARNLGLGIILVKTKAYENKSNIQKKSMHDTMGLSDGYKKE